MTITYGAPNLNGKKLGGGPFDGFSPKQTITNYKSSDMSMTRRILRDSWNTPYATGSYNNHKRVITPFRAVTNLGDFLARENYVCGGPSPITADRYKRKNNMGSIISLCDKTGVPSSSCNVKFVSDSSDYITYKKQQAINQTYNDLGFGGYNNASFDAWMRIHRK
jgi:hypothetical protein